MNLSIWRVATVAAVVLVAFISTVVWGLGRVGLIQDRVGIDPVPAFLNGQMVRMVAFGTEGMVVQSFCHHKWGRCTYSIRFSALRIGTDVRLFGDDGPVDFAPIAIVHGIKEFEMELRP